MQPSAWPQECRERSYEGIAQLPPPSISDAPKLEEYDDDDKHSPPGMLLHTLCTDDNISNDESDEKE